MTNNSNQKYDNSQQPERAESASSTTPFEPDQLELFGRWTGDGGWIQESPYESGPSRDFMLPPASTLAADLKPTDSSRASAKPASAPPSRNEGDYD